MKKRPLEKRTVVIEMDKLLWDDIQRRSLHCKKDGTPFVERTWVTVAIRSYLRRRINDQHGWTADQKAQAFARFDSDGIYDNFAVPTTPEDQQWLDDFIERQIRADEIPPDNPRPGDGDGRF